MPAAAWGSFIMSHFSDGFLSIPSASPLFLLIILIVIVMQGSGGSRKTLDSHVSQETGESSIIQLHGEGLRA